MPDHSLDTLLLRLIAEAIGKVSTDVGNISKDVAGIKDIIAGGVSAAEAKEVADPPAPAA